MIFLKVFFVVLLCSHVFGDVSVTRPGIYT